MNLASDLADAKTAITVIATAIDAVTDFEDLRNDADGVLATASHLAKAGSFGALDTATFNSTKASAVANNAPTDIDITDIAFTSAAGDDGEFTSSLVFTLSGTDADAGADGTSRSLCLAPMPRFSRRWMVSLQKENWTLTVLQ